MYDTFQLLAHCSTGFTQLQRNLRQAMYFGLGPPQTTCFSNSKSFNVLLTVHLSIVLVNDQLDAQFLYFIIRLLQSYTCFEQRRAHHQEVKFY
jgi:hypothetical protein